MSLRSSSGNGGNATTITVPVPAGAAVGDVIVIGLGVDDQGLVLTGMWPVGFSPLADGIITADGHGAGLCYKRLTAADSGTYSFQGSSGGADWVVEAFCFSGRHATNNPVASTYAVQNTPQSSPVTATLNGVTAVTGDDLLWWVAADRNGGTSTANFTAPASYTEREDRNQGWSSASGATRDAVSAGATGTVAGTFTLSAGTAGWGGWLVRIPAGAGTSGSMTTLAATATAADAPAVVTGTSDATLTAPAASGTAQTAPAAITGAVDPGVVGPWSDLAVALAPVDGTLAAPAGGASAGAAPATMQAIAPPATVGPWSDLAVAAAPTDSTLVAAPAGATGAGALAADYSGEVVTDGGGDGAAASAAPASLSGTTSADGTLVAAPAGAQAAGSAAVLSGSGSPDGSLGAPAATGSTGAAPGSLTGTTAADGVLSAPAAGAAAGAAETHSTADGDGTRNITVLVATVPPRPTATTRRRWRTP